MEDMAARSINLKIAITYFLILITAQLICVYMLWRRPSIPMAVIVGLSVGLILPIALGVAVTRFYKVKLKLR
jgi:type III secretory pathway component EscS